MFESLKKAKVRYYDAYYMKKLFSQPADQTLTSLTKIELFVACLNGSDLMNIQTSKNLILFIYNSSGTAARYVVRIFSRR